MKDFLIVYYAVHSSELWTLFRWKSPGYSQPPATSNTVCVPGFHVYDTRTKPHTRVYMSCIDRALMPQDYFDFCVQREQTE